MQFIGLDLGWQSGPSGLCCLRIENDKLRLTALNRIDRLEDVLDEVDRLVPSPEPAMLGVDAPLIIPNETGMRVPDKLAHRYFGKFHAGCYPANLGRPFAQRLLGFSRALEKRGFIHGSDISPRTAGRFQVEVFPHIATIQLFRLERILKYKKGRLGVRSQALNQLRQHILSDLSQHDPALILNELPEIPTTGKALKAVEDQLDAILCAYVAAYWWMWGLKRNAMLGNQQEGYIVVPVPPEAPLKRRELP